MSTVTGMACVAVSLSNINLSKEGSLNGRHSIEALLHVSYSQADKFQMSIQSESLESTFLNKFLKISTL